ncbi:unnamed protein product, partial [marine sediment metagenome]
MLKKRVDNVINNRHVYTIAFRKKFMKIDRNTPYNQLPPLPPNIDIESKKILKKVTSSHRQLA